MSLIEQAARRLEELRRSGIEVPARSPKPVPPAPHEALPAAVAHRIEAAMPANVIPAQPALRAATHPLRDARSKRIEIDLQRLAAMGYLTPDAPRAQIADEFRIIKRPLLTNINGKGAAAVRLANVVMVTSSLPGEGKTFVSINLAISMAMELGKTVLLVDADVARPSVLSRLGLPQAPGLLDILERPGTDLADVLLKTNIEGLTILPAGAPRGHATELLASDHMLKLIDDLATRYPDRILVFDAPPLLPSTESRVLATYMGQVVAVIEADQTPQKTVAQALATIEACPVVMTLLNKTARSDVSSYYGYYRPLEQ